MSCESIEFNEDDMDENPGAKKEECDIGDILSDRDKAIESNIDAKMKGYNIKNKGNFKAMKKIVIDPLLFGGNVVIQSEAIE